MASKYLDTYKKRKKKKQAKKIKRKLAKAGYAGVYHPPKKGADPKSLRDIGHMQSRTNEDQGEHGHIHNEGLWNTPSSKQFRSTLPKKKYKKLYKEVKKRRKK